MQKMGKRYDWVSKLFEDKPWDIEAGEKCGIQSFLVK